MFASRLARCVRFPPLPKTSIKPPHSVARQTKVRNYNNTPFNRPRYVRFGASGPEEPRQGKGNPWDVRNWDNNTKVAAGIGAFVVGYYVTQCVCTSLLSMRGPNDRTRMHFLAMCIVQLRKGTRDGSVAIYGHQSQV